MQQVQLGRTLTSVLAIATNARSAYRFGDMVGIAANTALANEANEFHVEGVYEVVKPNGETWVDGTAIYATGAAGAAVVFTNATAAGRVFVGNVHTHDEGVWAANYASAALVAKVRFNGAPRVV
jgi:predicted RecA/RadA family phage recombinase